MSVTPFMNLMPSIVLRMNDCACRELFLLPCKKVDSITRLASKDFK